MENKEDLYLETSAVNVYTISFQNTIIPVVGMGRTISPIESLFTDFVTFTNYVVILFKIGLNGEIKIVNYLLIVLVTHCLRVTRLISWFKVVFCRLLSIDSKCFVINVMMVWTLNTFITLYLLRTSVAVLFNLIKCNFLCPLLTYGFYFMKYLKGNSSTKI